MPVKFSPMPLGLGRQLKDHHQRRQARTSALRLPRPMAHRRKRRFDRIRRPNVHPMFSRKIIEREQIVFIPFQTVRRFRVFSGIFREESPISRPGFFLRWRQVHLMNQLLGKGLNAPRKLV